MNKTKTNPFHLLKFVLLVPMATILLLAFRNKQEVVARKPLENSTTKTYILSSLTYAIPDKKVEEVVKKEQDKCLFKRGQAMNLDLDLFLQEHDRLKKLLEKSGYSLEKSGYTNRGNHGIIFMVDTTLGNNNFSVELNINLSRNQLTLGKEELPKDGKISTPINDIERSTGTGRPVVQAHQLQGSNNKDEDELEPLRIFNSNLFAVK